MLRHPLLAVVAIALLCSCAFTQSAPIGEATLCELAKSGTGMSERTVRLHAIYITDLLHGTVLKDRQCPSVSFSIRDAEEPQLDPSVEDFHDTVTGEPDDLDLRIFLIEASGLFVRQPGATSRDVFTLQKIWNFRRLRGNDWKTAE